MVSSRTENRNKKRHIIKFTILSMLEIVDADVIKLDRVNMAEFKKLEQKVKEIKEGVYWGNLHVK